MRRTTLLILSLVLVATLLVVAGLSQFQWAAPTSAGRQAAQQAPDPLIQSIIDGVKSEEIRETVSGLSGARPITVGGQTVTLKTRSTPSSEGTLAEQYVHDYFASLGLRTAYNEWSGANRCAGISGRNVVAEIPGSVDPTRIFIIAGHLDSTSPRPGDAPGADDNASGTAAVMIAARLLKDYRFSYTLRFVAFTGEERGLCGSTSYSQAARQRNEDIRGVINVDMIGYNSDANPDVEVHAGTRADSQEIAKLLISNITTYQLNLAPHLLTETATELSDHSPFWRQNYPAIATTEYLFSGDGNPYIHSVACCDTVERMDFGMATDYARAAIATLAMLGQIEGRAQAASTPLPAPTFAPTSVPTPAIPGSGSRMFPETGRTVRGKFLEYWERNGGLARYGYPLSEQMQEKSETDGKTYTVQYFERAVFEFHPENQPPHDVLLQLLGTMRYNELYGRFGASEEKASAQPGAERFPQTGKTVGGKFLQYWKRNGGLAQYGYPISEEFVEQNPLDDKLYTVQYFERAVFELHPENQPPYDVLLSQLGTFHWRSKHGAGVLSLPLARLDITGLKLYNCNVDAGWSSGSSLGS